jgi:hypothetical protein
MREPTGVLDELCSILKCPRDAEALLEAARRANADTERLDWMENEPADVIFTFSKRDGHKFFVTNFNGAQSDKSNLRESIDEANSLSLQTVSEGKGKC